MLCSSCQYENPADALFCEECGAKLEQVCPACGAANKPGARFCKRCGERLAASSTPPQTTHLQADRPPQPPSTAHVLPEGPSGPGAPSGGAGKRVTALFADIKGSTELEQDLDPEQARAIVDPALKLMIDAVHRYDGYVVHLEFAPVDGA